MSEPQITLYPPWKQAVPDFLAAGFKPGDLVPHSWFEAHFGMDRLDDDTALTIQEHRERQFEWLGNIECFKTALLEQHRIFLQSVFGQGYRWCPAHEQTGVAVKAFEREAKRVYRQVGSRLMNVEAAALDDAQRKENLDAIGKISMLEGMHRSLE